MQDRDIQAINERVKGEAQFVEKLFSEIHKVIIGQRYLVERMLIGLLTKGHVLVEGVPGLAKTLSVKTLSDAVNARFQRIQFTPDLLPADLVGTMVYDQRNGTFYAKKGPIFANLVLADEINRAPAKVQSALLEAMQERQVTIGENTFKLEEPFLVLATQNPIEHEGTYPLPEAQIDRFMLKLKVVYPTPKEERQILDLMTSGVVPTVNRVVEPAEIARAAAVAGQIYIDERLKDNYIIPIVLATRKPAEFGLEELSTLIQWGASPRATIYLTMASRALAFIRGRGYVTPDDIKSVAMDVLRHRIMLTYEAEAEEVSTEDIVKRILDKIEVP